MKKEEKFDELKQLTDLDDITVEETAASYPFLDSSAKARIEALCERKMSMNRKNTNITNEFIEENEVVYTENVEHVKRIPWYRKPSAAIAASLALVVGMVGVGAASLSGGNKGEKNYSSGEVVSSTEKSSVPDKETENSGADLDAAYEADLYQAKLEYFRRHYSKDGYPEMAYEAPVEEVHGKVRMLMNCTIGNEAEYKAYQHYKTRFDTEYEHGQLDEPFTVFDNKTENVSVGGFFLFGNYTDYTFENIHALYASELDEIDDEKLDMLIDAAYDYKLEDIAVVKVDIGVKSDEFEKEERRDLCLIGRSGDKEVPDTWATQSDGIVFYSLTSRYIDLTGSSEKGEVSMTETTVQDATEPTSESTVEVPSEVMEPMYGINGEWRLKIMNFGGMESSTANVILLEEDKRTINGFLESCKFEEGTGDCLCEYFFCKDDGSGIAYHSECGTFNDFANEKSFTVTESMRQEINAILAKYTGELTDKLYQ